METEEYKFIKERLNSPEDVDLIHGNMGYKKRMLFNILARKIVRKVMRNYYKIKPKAKHMLEQWKKGKTFYEISQKYDFSPVLTAFFILNEKNNISKKRYQDMIKNPDEIKDKRLKKELIEVVENDFVYSPKSMETQKENGEGAEDKLEIWLEKKNINFMTENEQKASMKDEKGQKTPDFLLDKEYKIDGFPCRWVESKASFGSPNEIKRNYKKQFKPYLDLFGPGLVVYWYGFVNDVKLNPNFKIVDEEFFD